MSQIKGVDTSASSIPATTLTVDNFTANPADTVKSSEPSTTLPPPTVPQFFNGVVTPNLQVLLHNVLSIIDASIPNKEQNKAVKNLIHDGFDKAYLDIVRESYPDSNFQMGPGHAINPESDKFKAIMGASKGIG